MLSLFESHIPATPGRLTEPRPRATACVSRNRLYGLTEGAVTRIRGRRSVMDLAPPPVGSVCCLHKTHGIIGPETGVSPLSCNSMTKCSSLANMIVFPNAVTSLWPPHVSGGFPGDRDPELPRSAIPNSSGTLLQNQSFGGYYYKVKVLRKCLARKGGRRNCHRTRLFLPYVCPSCFLFFLFPGQHHRRMARAALYIPVRLIPHRPLG